MKDITTKEHLLHFMQSGFMRLSKYDLKFVQNLLHIINQSNTITSNQESLFKKLLEKYQRQLEKHQFTAQVISNLPWVAKIKPSDPYYTEAYIEIVDNQIYFKSPYNKNFISSFRDITANPFKWVKDKRRYEAPFNTLSLRCIVNVSAKHYPIVNYCPITIKLLNTLLEFDDVTIWDPTLIKVNDNYIIAGCNQYLHDAIQHIPLNDDLKTLSLLAEYGIKAHESVTNNDPKLLFASQFIPSVDYLSVDEVIRWLAELGCDYVLLENLGIDIVYRKTIRTKLSDVGITVFDSINKFTQLFTEEVPTDEIKESMPKAKFPVKIEFSTFQISEHHRSLRKVIKMTNSTPINIK